MTSHRFVLVHGAWGGGWCWRRVARLLTARGHDVFTPTLTGLADRSHLLSRDIDLDTHIADVVNVIRWERLQEVVLVGHSYGGWVISGAVERALPAISSIVYVDAFMPENGQRGLDLQPPDMRAATLAAIEKGEMSRPPPPIATFAINDRDRNWVESKLTSQPIGTALQPIRMTGAREKVTRKTYIRATGAARPQFDQYVAALKSDPSWRIYEVPCGHAVMIDMPERLAEILQEVA